MCQEISWFPVGPVHQKLTFRKYKVMYTVCSLCCGKQFIIMLLMQARETPNTQLKHAGTTNVIKYKIAKL